MAAGAGAASGTSPCGLLLHEASPQASQSRRTSYMAAQGSEKEEGVAARPS